MMKKGLFILIVLLISISAYSQKIGIKNNLIYDATLTPNLALEIGLGKKTTLDIGGGYNPFTFSDNKRFKHWLAQPEFRYWTCEKFNGLFFGLHAHGGEFSVGGFKAPFNVIKDLRDHLYEGWLVGGGVSVGYQWILSNRWNLELSVGGGFAHIQYDKYPCADCGPKLESGHYNYWGITRATLSIIYIIK